MRKPWKDCGQAIKVFNFISKSCTQVLKTFYSSPVNPAFDEEGLYVSSLVSPKSSKTLRNLKPSLLETPSLLQKGRAQVLNLVNSEFYIYIYNVNHPSYIRKQLHG